MVAWRTVKSALVVVLCLSRSLDGTFRSLEMTFVSVYVPVRKFVLVNCYGINLINVALGIR